ncbi:hypothetical protein BDV18DRAFT_49981 [Aspergillus unguis]
MQIGSSAMSNPRPGVSRASKTKSPATPPEFWRETQIVFVRYSLVIVAATRPSGRSRLSGRLDSACLENMIFSSWRQGPIDRAHSPGSASTHGLIASKQITPALLTDDMGKDDQRSGDPLEWYQRFPYTGLLSVFHALTHDGNRCCATLTGRKSNKVQVPNLADRSDRHEKHATLELRSTPLGCFELLMHDVQQGLSPSSWSNVNRSGPPALFSRRVEPRFAAITQSGPKPGTDLIRAA